MLKTNDRVEFRIQPSCDPNIATVLSELHRPVLIDGDDRYYPIAIDDTPTLQGYTTIARENQLTKIGAMVFISNKQIADIREEVECLAPAWLYNSILKQIDGAPA